MAFFGSKSLERELKRSFSTDRVRRDRTRSTRERTDSSANSITVAQIQIQSQSQPHTHAHLPRPKKSMPSADEFGVLSSNRNGKGEGDGRDRDRDHGDPPSLTFSTTTTTTSGSASLPAEPITPSLSVPGSMNGVQPMPMRSSVASSSSLSSLLQKQPQHHHHQHSSRTRTVSANGSGSKPPSSHSSSRRRSPQLGVDGTSPSDTRTRPNSGSSGSKHRTDELKADRAAPVPKSRSKTSLRDQPVIANENASVNTSDSPPKTPARPPRGARPSDVQASSPQPSLSPSLSSPSNTGLPLRQHSHSASVFTRDESKSSLPVPSNPKSNSVSKKSSCGNASDSSYGTPFSDFGVGVNVGGVGGFSVKRLLSKPAASSTSPSGGGVRSEPDTNTSTADSFDSYGAYGYNVAAAAARRRRVEGRSNLTDTPSSVYSLTGLGMDATTAAKERERARKPVTSDPETPRDVLGSLGRARGMEWGHVLSREREKERERGKAHAREGSSYSLSSPSEGAPGYPYGLAYERERRAGSGKNHPRPVIQLTTSAVRRLSALGAREVTGYERDRSHSPGTPMTFGPGPGTVSVSPSPVPSPLTTTSTSTRAKAAGRLSGQPSPTTSAAAVAAAGGAGSSSVGVGVVKRAESPKPPVGLTPAEIVAHQYKEQERRRAELEREMTRSAEVPEKIHTSMKAEDLRDEHDKAQRTVRVKEKEKDKDKERSKGLLRRTSANAVSSPTSSASHTSHKTGGSLTGEPPTPYYTVFGEPTGKIVAIGSARDSAFGLFDKAHDRRAKAVVAEISGTSSAATSATATAFSISDTTVSGGSGEEKTKTLRRKLSRKMSGKVKREGSTNVGINAGRGAGRSGGGGVGGRESGKESSDGKDDKLDFGDVLAGGSLSGDDWFTTYGTEGRLRARPSLTVNLNTNTTTSTSTITPSSVPVPGRRSATLPREKNASASVAHAVKMSMDSGSFVAVQRIDSNLGGTLPSVPNGAASNPNSVAKTRLKDEKDREREREKEKEKGKLWGLMRRISSNTLKDKYKRSSMEVVPPVPVLPSTHALPTLELEEEYGTKDSDQDAYAIRLDTPPLRSNSKRPSTAPALNLDEPSKEGRFATLRKKPSITQVQNQLLGTSPTQGSRPARSPSPISSDRQADKSSPMSSGAKHHPLLVEHILPPETLCMFDELNLNFEERKEDDMRSKIRDSHNTNPDVYSNLFYSEDSEPTCQALPVPPRRPPQAKPEADIESDDFRSESPTIPSFSSDNAINAFGLRKRTATTGGAASIASGFTGADFGTEKPSAPSVSPASSTKGSSNGSLEPPPRPPRSARRGPPPGATPGTPTSLQASHGSPPSPLLVRAVFEDRAARTSISGHSQASTARPSVLRGSSSPCSTPSPPPELLDSQSPVSASDSNSSAMTFRDMSGAATKTAWTEKEKMDKWNDLLDRSEKAGGTLHVGLGGALLSDQLQESSYEPSIRDSLYSSDY